MDEADDFADWETVAGTVRGFQRMRGRHALVRYVLVETDGGRRTRVHRRAFTKARINPRNLSVGDRLTLYKLCYMPEHRASKWSIVASPLMSHSAEKLKQLVQQLKDNNN